MLWSGILYFSSREVTTSLCEQRCDDWSHAGAPVMQMELMSSRSVVKAIFCWPRPVVYLPAPALSNFSVGIIRFRCRALRGGAHRARSGRRMSGGNRRQWRLCRHSEGSAPCRGGWEATQERSASDFASFCIVDQVVDSAILRDWCSFSEVRKMLHGGSWSHSNGQALMRPLCGAVLATVYKYSIWREIQPTDRCRSLTSLRAARCGATSAHCGPHGNRHPALR